ncbi:MAG: Do family serine endopeptidase [Crocinitomicaceae bacterium]|nr:Do family serine endopeptidase [Crocinitomicaceae bacterium]
MKKLGLTLGVGLLGGIIPLAAWLTFMQPNPSTNTTESAKRVLMEEPGNFVRTVNNINPSGYVDFREASQNTINSVVHVKTTVIQKARVHDPIAEFFYGPHSRTFKGEASGSGVIISNDGYIVTNNHVVENASDISITLNDNTTYKAEVIGTDPSTDIALLKVEGKELSSIPVGNSDQVEIGEWVLAVGNPFNLTSTVTAGIVSAKGRNINILREKYDPDRNIIPIESFIQTDAAVNPGNSGGALVNSKGELIGINTAIASNTGSYTGYSFAVPVNLVKKVVNDLMEYGMVQRGYLGINIANISSELMKQEHLTSQKGVYVSGLVEKGAAKAAGIKEGDVILQIDENEINSVAQLQEYIGKKRPGDKVMVHLTREGVPKAIEVTLKDLNGDTKLISKAEVSKKSALGATFELLDSKEKKDLGIDYGIKIERLDFGKFKSRGFYEGIVISKVNNKPIESVEEFVNILNSEKDGILLEVIHTDGRKDFVGFGL